MRTSRHLLYAILAWLAPTFVLAAGSSFADLMRGMASGLALLGQANNTTAPSYLSPVAPFYPTVPGAPWSAPSAIPGWGMPRPGMPGFAASPWAGFPGYSAPAYNRNPVNEPTSPRVMERLQGSWKTDKGGLLLVKRDMARLYITLDQYQDFYIRADTRYLWMWPVGSQGNQRYEHHISSDRIILRDEFGSSLTLLRYQHPSAE